jgi:type IV pilus assembly protein PilV
MSSRSSGFTMIEVLVAMLVIGTGALAMVMLQLQALRGSRDNALHAGAVALAVELAELRAAQRAGNPYGADPYLFSFDAAQGTATSAPDCIASACDADGFARAAIADWNARLARDFPGARAVVCRDAGARAGTPADWRCDDDPAAPVVAKLGWRRASAGGTSAVVPLATVFIGP